MILEVVPELLYLTGALEMSTQNIDVTTHEARSSGELERGTGEQRDQHNRYVTAVTGVL